MKIYIINIKQTKSDEYYSNLISCVSDEKRARIEKFHFIDDAKRTLYADILVRYLVCKTLNISNEKLIFSTSKLGKPFLVGYSDFYYNISHSGEWVACAVSDGEIGIDVEQVKPIDFEIAKRFFTEYEYSEIMTKSQNEQLDYFFSIWTLKESYIKCIGKGLSEPLNSFGFDLKSEEIILISDCKAKYYFKQVGMGKYKIAVCSTKQEINGKIEIYNMGDRIDEIIATIARTIYPYASRLL